MKIKNIKKDLNEDFWNDWWEYNSSDINTAFGDEGKRDDKELAYAFKSGKNSLIACNFLPRGITDGSISSRGLTLRARLDLIVGRLFENDVWDSDKSRVMGLVELGSRNDTIKNIMMLQRGSDKKNEEISGPDNPSVGEWVRFLARSLKKDILDSKVSHEERKNAINYVKEEVNRWQLLQKDRGYQTFPEKMITKDVNNELRFVYDMELIPENEQSFASIYNGITGGSKAVMAIDEGRKDAVALEYTPSVYMSYEAWENAFKAYNARALHSRLWTAKATNTMPTTYPGRVVEVPEDLKEKFNNAQKVAYLKSSMTGDNKERFYLYNIIDEEGKETGRISVDKDTFDKLRIKTNPLVTLPNAKNGRYKGCNKTRNGNYYMYVDESGKTHSFEEDEHFKIIETNKNNPDSPTSVSMRGHIDDLFEKFFISATPNSLIAKKPMEEDKVKELRDTVRNNVLAVYKPIWDEVVNETDQDLKKQKIDKGMQILLEGVEVQKPSKECLERLKELETKGRGEISYMVKDKCKAHLVVEYCEKKYGIQSENYKSYTPTNKYEFWKKELTSSGKTEADKNKLFANAIKEMVEDKEVRAPQVDVKKVIDHFNKGIMEDLHYTAKLMTGDDKLPEFKSLRDAAEYFEPTYLEDYYKDKKHKYSIHYNPTSNELPYIARKRPQLAYTETKNRKTIDTGQFISKVRPEQISKVEKIKEVSDQTAVIEVKDKDLTDFGNKLLDVLRTLNDNYEENPSLFEDLNTALLERAEGNEQDVELKEMLKDLSPNEAALILKKFEMDSKPVSKNLVIDR